MFDIETYHLGRICFEWPNDYEKEARAKAKMEKVFYACEKEGREIMEFRGNPACPPYIEMKGPDREKVEFWLAWILEKLKYCGCKIV